MSHILKFLFITNKVDYNNLMFIIGWCLLNFLRGDIVKYSKIIHYIEKIDEIGNLSKASNALFISQPALSKFIQSIETKTGIKLFNKTRRSLHLSFAGERYLSYLKKINGLELDMRNELELISQNKKGKVTLGINSALATSTLYKFLPQFHQQNLIFKLKS